jgi:hypothetical protein
MNTYADDATQGHKNTSRSNSFFAALMVLVCIGIGWFAGRSNSGNPKQQPSAVGVYVPSLSVVTLAGVKETITLERAERLTVVYVLSPDCRWCSYNMRNIKSLAASRSGECRFIGISLRHPDLAHYAELNKLPFPMFQIDSLDSAPNLLLGQIPETIVIDKAWEGCRRLERCLYGESTLSGFTKAVGAYVLVPHWSASTLGLFIPLLELWIAIDSLLLRGANTLRRSPPVCWRYL